VHNKSFTIGVAIRVGKAADTKGKILDAAEALFADIGYDAVSMRDVAARARILLGLITYHFRTKEALFEEVIGRRAEELNRGRREALALLADPTIEEILDAFLRPYLRLMRTGGSGWHSYGRLMAQIGQSERWAKLSARHFSKLGHVVIEKMMAAEPKLSKAMAVHGYVHLVSVMFGVFASSGLLDIFSDGILHSSDIAAAYDSMIRFTSGGLRSLAAGGSMGSRSPRKRAARRAPRSRVISPT
jgi:AcrR family transcriptional regulator